MEKMSEVSPYSTISPTRKKAVKSETRVACCMLWVTMMMVYFSFKSAMSSSIFIVEMGSKAEVGSSISTRSG